MVNIRTKTGSAQINEQNVAVIEYCSKSKEVTITLANGENYNISHVKDYLPYGTPFKELEDEKLFNKKLSLMNQRNRQIGEIYWACARDIEYQIEQGKLDNENLKEYVLNAVQKAYNREKQSKTEYILKMEKLKQKE